MTNSNPLIQSVIYTLIALTSEDYTTSKYALIGAVVLGLCSFYWIWKGWEYNQMLKGMEWEANERAKSVRRKKRYKNL